MQCLFKATEVGEQALTTGTEVPMLARAKALISVNAGVIPGQPMPEYTRRWGWTSGDQERLAAGEKDAQALYIRIAGESREYAASLENPHLVNWVRRDWIWL